MESGLDDIPIVAKGTYQMDNEEKEDENIVEQGPLERRLESKNWKTRSIAYEEVLVHLQSTKDFSMFVSQVPKFLNDPNPNPQEKALEILNFYLLNSSFSLAPHCESLTKVLIEKYISGPRANLKEKAKELLANLYQIDKEKILLEMLKYSTHKTLKFQQGLISALNALVSLLGPKIFEFKKALSCIEKAAENTNVGIRTEALEFYKELHKYIGEATETFTTKLKKQQQDELKKFFELTSSTIFDKNADFDCLDAKNIFVKYNERWSEKVLATEKWSEKRDLLVELNEQANFPKLVEENPGFLVQMAKKLMNDSNINVVVQAIRLVGYLAKGQKKYFEGWGKLIAPVLFAKFKDKKPQIVQEVDVALGNLMFSVNIETVFNCIEAALNDKAIGMKVNTLAWIEKKGLMYVMTENFAKILATVTKKCLEDSCCEVRDAATSLLQGIFKKYDGLKVMLADIAPAKLKKLESSAKPLQTQESFLAKSIEKPKRPVEKKSSPKECEESSEMLIDSCIPEHILQNLSEKSWIAKQTGFKDLESLISSSLPTSELIGIHQTIIRTLNKFKENNPNIIKSGVECLILLYSSCKIPEKCATQVLTLNALSKLADSKVSECFASAILYLCETATPDFVIKSIISNTSQFTKPKVSAECLDLIGTIIKEFGISIIDLRSVAQFAKVGLLQTNPIIKKAASNLISVLYAFKAEQILEFLDGVKDTILAGFREEFKKNPTALPVDFRKCREVVAVKSSELFQKTNISSQITPQFLKELSDPDWKIRKISLEKLNSLASKKIAAQGLAELFRKLKSLLSDSNKMIIKFTLTVLAKLADSLGTEIVGYSRLIIPHIIGCLADKQASLRQEAQLSLEKWGVNAGADSIISMSGPLLSQDSPEMRTDLLSWILSNRESIKTADIKSLIPGILSCLQDKSTKIRGQAELLFGEIIDLTGFDPIQPFLKDIKPAFMKPLQVVFNKYQTGEYKSAKNKNGQKRIQCTYSRELEFIVVDKKVKSENIKWTSEEMRKDQIELVKNDLKSGTSEELYGLMFNQDFKQKIVACDNIKRMLENEDFPYCLELVFKWFFLEFIESNPQVVKGILELELAIFQNLRTKSYNLTDVEAEIAIPALFEKLTANNNFYLQIIQKVMQEAIFCYPGEHFFTLMISTCSVKSSNKYECLQVVFDLYKTHLCPLSGKDLKTLIFFQKSQEASLKSVSLNMMHLAYSVMGKRMVDLIGPGHEKLLETFPKPVLLIETMENSRSLLSHKISKLGYGDAEAKIEALNFFKNEVFEHLDKYKEELKNSIPELITNLCKGFRGLCSFINRESLNSTILSLLDMAKYLFSKTNILGRIPFELLKEMYEDFIMRASDVSLEILKEISVLLVFLLDRSDVNDSLKILIPLLNKTQEDSTNLQINIKCILKISKCLPRFSLNPSEILLKMHELLSIRMDGTNENIMKVLKTLLQEMVFLLGEEILESYNNAEISNNHNQEDYISTWINFILVSRYPVEKIFNQLKDTESYNEGLKMLNMYINKNESCSLEFFFKRYPNIANRVKNNLEESKGGEKKLDPSVDLNGYANMYQNKKRMFLDAYDNLHSNKKKFNQP